MLDAQLNKSFNLGGDIFYEYNYCFVLGRINMINQTDKEHWCLSMSVKIICSVVLYISDMHVQNKHDKQDGNFVSLKCATQNKKKSKRSSSLCTCLGLHHLQGRIQGGGG